MGGKHPALLPHLVSGTGTGWAGFLLASFLSSMGSTSPAPWLGPWWDHKASMQPPQARRPWALPWIKKGPQTPRQECHTSWVNGVIFSPAGALWWHFLCPLLYHFPDRPLWRELAPKEEFLHCGRHLLCTQDRQLVAVKRMPPAWGWGWEGKNSRAATSTVSTGAPRKEKLQSNHDGPLITQCSLAWKTPFTVLKEEGDFARCGGRKGEERCPQPG